MLTNSAAAIRAAARTAMILALIPIAMAVASAQTDAAGFFRSITGEWIGACEQTTDGQKADDKYFHAVVKQTAPNTYVTSFQYYRLDKNTGKPAVAGVTSVTTDILPDGSARNTIVGSGSMMVDGNLKNQKHELTETVRVHSENNLSGTSSGKISVNGMPFGLGKNGKISDSTSNWTMKNGTLVIDQKLSAGFKALFFTKKFRVQFRSTAVRGSDVTKLMTDGPRRVVALK